MVAWFCDGKKTGRLEDKSEAFEITRFQKRGNYLAGRVISDLILEIEISEQDK